MLRKPSLIAAVFFGSGFALATWLNQPAPAAKTEPAPLRTRAEHPERPTRTAKSDGKPAAALQRWQEAGNDRDKRAAVLASLSAEEIPALLADFKERAGLYASTFDPAAQENERYKDAWAALSRPHSSGLLDDFLQAAPGVRTAHLDGLLAQSRGWSGEDIDETRALILERMDPARRVVALRRYCGDGIPEEQRNRLAPTLRRLGHSEQEIKTLLPLRQQ